MIETRKIAGEIVSTHAELLDSSVTLHVSGCAKGCAHPAAASLTVVGDEKGAGLVVDGTAKTLPIGYRPSCDAARAIGGVAAVLGSVRRGGETAAACLARLGTDGIANAYRQE